MISTASSSMPRRTCAAGPPPPATYSLRFSPEPRRGRNALSGLRGGTEDAPRVRGVPLAFQRGEVMVGRDGDVETLAFGADHMACELAWPGMFGHHRVADMDHDADALLLVSQPCRRLVGG